MGIKQNKQDMLWENNRLKMLLWDHAYANDSVWQVSVVTHKHV